MAMPISGQVRRTSEGLPVSYFVSYSTSHAAEKAVQQGECDDGMFFAVIHAALHPRVFPDNRL